MKKMLLAAPALGLLAACGSTTEVAEVTISNFAELEAEYGAMTVDMIGAAYFDPADLPTTDSATYTGVYFQDQPSNDNMDLLGTANVDLDFATDAVSSTVTGLSMRNGTVMSGSLSGTGSFARAGSPDIFILSHGGTLTANGQTYDVSTFLQGAFSGDTGQYMELNGSGTVSVDGGPDDSISATIVATNP